MKYTLWIAKSEGWEALMQNIEDRELNAVLDMVRRFAVQWYISEDGLPIYWHKGFQRPACPFV